MATRGLDMVVPGCSEVIGSEGGVGAGGSVEGVGTDDGLGSTISAFVSFVSAKLSFCRFPGKHIAGIF